MGEMPRGYRAALARRAGVSPAYLSRIMRGKAACGRIVAVRLAAAAGAIGLRPEQADVRFWFALPGAPIL